MATGHNALLNDQKLMNDTGKAVDNYLAVSDELHGDLKNIETQTPGERRNFIRTVSAAIEGHVFAIRSLYAPFGHRLFSEKEKENLDEEEKKILDQLDEEEKKTFNLNKRLPIVKSFKHVMSTAHKVFSLPSKPNFESEEWNKAQEFFIRRHQVTHPKSLKDLEISEEEWERLFDGAFWMLEQVFGLMDWISQYPIPAWGHGIFGRTGEQNSPASVGAGGNIRRAP